MGYIVLGLIGLFLAVILLRTLLFRPKKQAAVQPNPVEFDRQAAVDALAALVQCKTISYHDHSLEDDREFEKLIALLPELYPNVFKVCSFDRLADRALLLRWPGKGSENVSVMMSHYDVVPVDEEKWEEPPFSATIKDGYLWGRGTLDTKGTLNAALSAANNLIAQGFVPENDVYFAFSGGEEVNGDGAKHIVQHFADQGITPALVLDEGGAVVENVFPGVKAPCGLIGIAEKGMMNVKYAVQSNGGHASAPKPNSPIPVVAKAVRRLEKKPFKMRLNKPAALMFDTLGRHSNFLFRLIFANMWCFGWAIGLLGRLSGGDINALVRTTVAFTQMQGSSARNVIPTEAHVISNMRLNPDDSVASAKKYLEKVVADPKVSITVLESSEPSRISRTDCSGWDMVAAAVAETWQGCIVSPYLMVQCSDSRHYGRISDRVYRFSAMDLTTEERKSIHGNNERIRLETIEKSVEFYMRLLKKC
jgi:carboxypeptidase PM20D1